MLDTSKLNPTAILRLGVTFNSVEDALDRVKDGEGALVVAQTLVTSYEVKTNSEAEHALYDLNWAEARYSGDIMAV